MAELVRLLPNAGISLFFSLLAGNLSARRIGEDCVHHHAVGCCGDFPEVADAGNQVTKDLSEAAAGVVGEIVSGVARSLLPASLTGENHKTKRQDAER